MGYRDFAKDYQIEYVDHPGKKRPKAVRIYVGPYFAFKASAERVQFLRWFYTIGLALTALFLLIPMCIDCAFTRTWYIQTPAVAAWIPWIFSAAAAWRLWTAGEKVDREHYELLHDRMSSACLFLMGFCLISCAGCAVSLSEQMASAADYVVCLCCMGAGICGIALFSKRKELEMVQVEPADPNRGKCK